MRANAMLIDHQGFDLKVLSDFYRGEHKSVLDDRVINSILEHLILSAHQLSALEKLSFVKPQADVARVASVAWYYGIYAAATAMVAAQERKVQDNHTQTANSWDRQLVQTGKILKPFDISVSTLLKKEAELEIDAYRRGPKTNLVAPPETLDQAHDYVAGYLSGTRKWTQWKIEEEIKKSTPFKKAGFKDFRTIGARAMRDERLKKQSISFVHQAIRFRGKANYREALYLAHGRHVDATIEGFIPDQAAVLRAFSMMAGVFCLRRVGREIETAFLDDLEKNRAFSLDPVLLWRSV
jgi:hypothetical protein